MGTGTATTAGLALSPPTLLFVINSKRRHSGHCRQGAGALSLALLVLSTPIHINFWLLLVLLVPRFSFFLLVACCFLLLLALYFIASTCFVLHASASACTSLPLLTCFVLHASTASSSSSSFSSSSSSSVFLPCGNFSLRYSYLLSVCMTCSAGYCAHSQAA